MNKQAEFAGTFYPEKPEELTNLLNSFKQDLDNDYKSKAIIVPHAGMYYSGYAAMIAYQHLEISENIFIIAPSHHKSFKNIALPKYMYFDTPLGSLEVNNRLANEIAEKYHGIIDDEIFEKEHSIEVQLPFIQNMFCTFRQSAIDFVKNLKKNIRKIKIVPILTGDCDYRIISDIIANNWENSSFIISSDLSHYYSQQECRQIDTYTATIIETGKLEFFHPQQACGLIGIKGLLSFANDNHFSLIRTTLYNSGDVTKDAEKVVGYGSWFLYCDNTNSFIKNYHTEYVLKVARAAIIAGINNEDFVPHNIPPVLNQYGASFITLKYKDSDKLRGCIGSVYPTKPLVLDIMDNAKNAAFRDTRFEPVRYEELNNLKISVSILSSIERINYRDEKDLLSKIYPYGIIISLKDYRAVYLPEVWEQLPDREIFFNSLKEKAGLSPLYFSNALEAYKFDTIHLTEE